MSQQFEWDAAKAASNLKNHGIMKRTAKRPNKGDNLRPEYDFSTMVSRSNPFATRMTGSVVAVVLEPDVAQVPEQAAAAPRTRRKAG